jgi:hypothetical protein
MTERAALCRPALIRSSKLRVVATREEQASAGHAGLGQAPALPESSRAAVCTLTGDAWSPASAEVPKATDPSRRP